jgi:hypothetical protein
MRMLDDAMATLVKALELANEAPGYERRVTALFDVWEAAQDVVDVYYRYEYWK